MLHEDGSAGVAVAGILFASHRTGAELRAGLDAKAQSFLALVVGKSLQTDLQQVSGLHPVLGKSPAGGSHLLVLVPAAWWQANRRHIIGEHSLPIEFDHRNIVFGAALFVVIIIARMNHIVDNSKVLHLGIVGGNVVVQLTQTNHKL